MIREPAVAGQFYPGRAADLAGFVDRALAADADGAARSALGVVSPHAGYIYSGAVAGAVFSRVQVPDSVLLLGPNHTGLGTPAGITSTGSWSTPLGTVPIDEALAGALRDACPLLAEDRLAHLHEHSLEVQVPFLQRRNPGIRIVPVALALRSPNDIESLGDALAVVLADWPEEVLMVASSDMTHYESSQAAEAKDRLAIDRILALDARGLWDTVRNHGISMCGVVPTTVLLRAAERLGASRAELVRYTNSGETSGDYASVVGYAGLVIPRPAAGNPRAAA